MVNSQEKCWENIEGKYKIVCISVVKDFFRDRFKRLFKYFYKQKHRLINSVKSNKIIIVYADNH